VTHSWDPEQYLRYVDERGRPFVDLLARVGASAPRTVVDLGCGPGTLTRLLAERWPEASVTALDSSEAMVERARREVDGVAGIDVDVADLRDWARAEEVDVVDVVVANAVLQWVPGHLDLLSSLVDRLALGGWLAFQVPGNFAEPSHVIRTEIAARAPYAEHTAGVAVPSAHDPAAYLAALRALGCAVDAWETTYLHVLTGDDPVLDWVSGTGARPTLEALPDDLRRAFTAEYGARLREAYPPGADGSVVLPFRRVFVVAQRPGGPA